MTNDQYQFSVDEDLVYSFESVGPKGTIKKAVRFRPQNSNGSTFFNVSLGHYNEQTREFDDTAISNNNDVNSILQTVAPAVEDFTMKFPDMSIYASGNTPSRTRLYQIKISSNLKSIEELFEIYGERDDHLEKFRANINYRGFLVRRRIK